MSSQKSAKVLGRDAKFIDTMFQP